MVYANVSAADLRASNVPEQVIRFVEHNRAHLQRTIQQQQMFRGVLKPNTQGQASEPGRMNPEAFPGIVHPQQQVGSMPPAGVRPPPPQGHPPPAGVNIPASSNGLPQPLQKPPPPNVAPIQASRPARPTPEQSQEAMQFIQQVKNEFIQKSEYLVCFC
jgi:hypothetical protein